MYNQYNQSNTEKEKKFDFKFPYMVRFDYYAYQTLKAYIQNINNEISGLAYVEFDKEIKEFYVKDIYLLEQEVTASTTDISPQGLADFQLEQLKENPDKAFRCWWHSHYNFGVFWSHVDDNTIKDFDTEEEDENWFLSIVSNHNEDILCRLDTFRPFQFSINNIPYTIDEDPQYLEIEGQAIEEIEEKVKKRKFYPVKAYYGNNEYNQSSVWGGKQTIDEDDDDDNYYHNFGYDNKTLDEKLDEIKKWEEDIDKQIEAATSKSEKKKLRKLYKKEKKKLEKQGFEANLIDASGSVWEKGKDGILIKKKINLPAL